MTTLRISKVLAIQNFGSSGSKFVHSLFDNHPEILAIPSLYMSSFYTFWPDDINKNTGTKEIYYDITYHLLSTTI